MFKKLIAYFRNGGAIVMHLLPPQPPGGEGVVASRSPLHATPQRGRALAVWEIPACQRRARSGDRVLWHG